MKINIYILILILLLVFACEVEEPETASNKELSVLQYDYSFLSLAARKDNSFVVLTQDSSTKVCLLDIGFDGNINEISNLTEHYTPLNKDYEVSFDQEGNYFLESRTRSSFFLRDFNNGSDTSTTLLDTSCVMKIAKDGRLMWKRTLYLPWTTDGTKWSNFYGVLPYDNSSDLLLTGYTDEVNSEDNKGRIIASRISYNGIVNKIDTFEVFNSPEYIFDNDNNYWLFYGFGDHFYISVVDKEFYPINMGELSVSMYDITMIYKGDDGNIYISGYGFNQTELRAYPVLYSINSDFEVKTYPELGDFVCTSMVNSTDGYFLTGFLAPQVSLQNHEVTNMYANGKGVFEMKKMKNNRFEPVRNNMVHIKGMGLGVGVTKDNNHSFLIAKDLSMVGNSLFIIKTDDEGNILN